MYWIFIHIYPYIGVKKNQMFNGCDRVWVFSVKKKSCAFDQFVMRFNINCNSIFIIFARLYYEVRIQDIIWSCTSYSITVCLFQQWYIIGRTTAGAWRVQSRWGTFSHREASPMAWLKPIWNNVTFNWSHFLETFITRL